MTEAAWQQRTMLTTTIFEAEVDLETSLIFRSACIAAALYATCKLQESDKCAITDRIPVVCTDEYEDFIEHVRCKHVPRVLRYFPKNCMRRQSISNCNWMKVLGLWRWQHVGEFLVLRRLSHPAVLTKLLGSFQ